MIWIACIMAVSGLFLSAFFSGSETGFYRVVRVRLVLDALSGDRIARVLIWLTNLPSLFIATTLVGNNLANYLTSLAIVIGTATLANGNSTTAQLIAPLAMAPILFVYGELLPKNLFLNAPNRLIRAGAPLFLVFFIIFLPISLVLWTLNKFMSRLLNSSPEPVTLTLARRELQIVLEEGHKAGILQPSQQRLAQGIFAVANEPASRYATPLRDVPKARLDMTKQEILRLANRYRVAEVAVEDSTPERPLIGYFRVINLGLDPSDEVGRLLPLMEIKENETQIGALMRMQSAGESLAKVASSKGETIGLLTTRSLREPLFNPM